jgi:hypothetical protein
MQSKLAPLVACCLLCAICVGQWSSPVPLLSGSPSIAGQSLVAGAGDTVWATIVTGQAGSSGPYQVLACWTTGGAWSPSAEVTPPDSGWMFSEPGIGRDASGRLWVAWYRGDYPTKESESSAVWAAYRDSAGWHAPEKVCSGVAAAGPMSFAADAAGNWYLGFATLTPYTDFAYSSAVYCRLVGDSWQSPRYIAHGMGSPIETNFLAPTLVSRPDSGLWASYDMFTFGDSIASLKIVQHDTARSCWNGDGSAPAATADSSGRLWVLYSQFNGYWLQSVLIIDSVEVESKLVSDNALGRGCATTDFEGIVWAAWKIRSFGSVAVNYSTGGSWSEPEQTSAMAGAPSGIAADANGRVYVLFRTTAGQLYSVYRTSRPGVQEPGPVRVACSRLPSIIRNVLFLPPALLSSRSFLLSADGRRMIDLTPGANDVSRLSPGVYFIREEGPGVHGFECPSRVVVVAR